MNQFNLKHRIKLLEKKDQLKSDSNCIGTSLFILGNIKNEYRIDPTYLDTFLEEYNLNLITEPEIYSLLLFVDTEESSKNTIKYYKRWNMEKGTDLKDLDAWCRPGIVHSGIVIELNPIKIIHRLSVNGKIHNNDTLNSHNLKPYSTNYDLKYCI